MHQHRHRNNGNIHPLAIHGTSIHTLSLAQHQNDSRNPPDSLQSHDSQAFQIVYTPSTMRLANQVTQVCYKEKREPQDHQWRFRDGIVEAECEPGSTTNPPVIYQAVHVHPI